MAAAPGRVCPHLLSPAAMGGSRESGTGALLDLGCSGSREDHGAIPIPLLSPTAAGQQQLLTICVLRNFLRPMAGFWSFHNKSRASLSTSAASTAHQPSPSQETVLGIPAAGMSWTRKNTQFVQRFAVKHSDLSYSQLQSISHHCEFLSGQLL